MQDYKKIYRKYLGIDWDSKQYEVHHIDGNRENNDISNLVLLPKKIHRIFHKIYNSIKYDLTPSTLDIDASHFIYNETKIYEFIELKQKIYWCIRAKKDFSAERFSAERYFYYINKLMD